MSAISSPKEQQNETASSNRSSTTTTARPESGTTDKATAELSIVVDELLNQLSAKFAGISEELISKMDDMSKRLDNLESSIQAGKAAPEK
ncbi:heat shock factor binding protein 1-domain-containing protein [Venturia nashicola]|uniref:Heat shock factor binding protein 1-domain-containing protein n=1 Tax=Venturia nashicola TaxID=86259 RepID=A0A4Z1NVI6_9PEZI|nr:heat shock factor binding protein 1-domain-containing protein [Venturia nashicola]TLD29646.1 heat shock factor binding protein 1-domain-containing protein [Venturia nashicola]